MGSRLDYRPDLDGLRAVAVVPVILFHLGFSYTPGGFVGVDVFFVLSGYLITRQIALELEHGNFSLLDFYDRRIRRLFPALFTMLFASAAVALLIVLPDDLLEFGQSLIAASFSVSNFHFWTESGYFAPAAETMPLLHTWSLAVEEQYYLLFPLLLMLIWRFGRSQARFYVCVLAAISFAASIWGSLAAPEAAFYLLPFRAWELLLGSLLALAPRLAPRQTWLRNAAALSGLAAIGIAVATFDARMTFPGFAAALPCLGCALVIWAGEPTVHSNSEQASPLALRFLALPPLVFIGLISYSLYLWHWPLIVFTQYLAPPGPLSVWLAAAVVAATLVISYASWKYIEQPLRRGDRIWTTRAWRFRYGGALVCAFALAGLTMELGKGFPGLQSKTVLATLEAAEDSSPLRDRCHIGARKQGKISLDETCAFGAANQRPVIVLGDSHGAELSYALSEVAKTSGLRVRQITASACPPATDFASSTRMSCPRHMDMMLRGLGDAPRSTVLLTAFYFEWASREASQRQAFWSGLDRVVARLREAGHEVILLGGWPPHGDSDLPRALALEVKSGRSVESYSFPIDERLAHEIDARLSGIAERHTAIYVPLLEAVCKGKSRCRAYAEGRAIYFDDDHLTVTSARRVVKSLILPLFERSNNATATAQPNTIK